MFVCDKMLTAGLLLAII